MATRKGATLAVPCPQHCPLHTVAVEGQLVNREMEDSEELERGSRQAMWVVGAPASGSLCTKR